MQPTLFYRIARFYSTEFLTYPLETAALIIRRLFVVGLLLLFWSLVARQNRIEGLQIVPYILIATGAQYLSVGQNFRQAQDISDEIKYGQLNNLLVRPVDELLYSFAAYIGKNVLEFVFSAMNIIIGLWLVQGVDPRRLGLFVVSLGSAFCIGYSLNILVASAAFWMTETTYFRLSCYFVLRVLSGLFLPLTFFSGLAAVILQHLPFAQVAFVPSYVITGDDLGKAATLVAFGWLQVPLMLWLARHIWQKGLSRYGAVGI